MKNPYFVGRPPSVSDWQSIGLKEALKRTGGNTGNLLFISALHRAVAFTKFTEHSTFDPQAVRSGHDGIIVPAANWINYSSDWGGLADKIEATKLPCVVVGLGAQSHSFERFPQPTIGTRRFVSVVAERSHSISVRGEYTADVLASMGVKNVTVTGCPSLLWHGRPNIVNVPKKRLSKISVSATRSDGFEKIFDPDASFGASLILSQAAPRLGLDYVAQTELADMQLASDYRELPVSDDSNLEFLLRASGVHDVLKLQNFLRSHLKVFFQVEQWLAYLKTQEYFVSTRLHGVIASILSGVPAQLVVHDTRTSEMAECLKIPAIEARKFVENAPIDHSSFQSMYDELEYGDFNNHQLVYFDRFIKFFEDNGVSNGLFFTAYREGRTQVLRGTA